jgi:hypothetical protein
MWRIGRLREIGDGFSLLAMGFTGKKAISQEKAHDQKIIPARRPAGDQVGTGWNRHVSSR